MSEKEQKIRVSRILRETWNRVGDFAWMFKHLECSDRKTIKAFVKRYLKYAEIEGKCKWKNWEKYLLFEQNLFSYFWGFVETRRRGKIRKVEIGRWKSESDSRDLGLERIKVDSSDDDIEEVEGKIYDKVDMLDEPEKHWTEDGKQVAYVETVDGFDSRVHPDPIRGWIEPVGFEPVEEGIAPAKAISTGNYYFWDRDKDILLPTAQLDLLDGLKTKMLMTCELCSLIYRPKFGGRPRRFCSEKCKDRAKYLRRKKQLE